MSTYYKGHHLPDLCLVAISGDCSESGMWPENEVLPFTRKHKNKVIDFLRAQQETTMHFHFNRHSDNAKSLMHLDTLDAAFFALKKVGVFHHKYHMRTWWELAYLDELEEIPRYHPYKVHRKRFTDVHGA